MMACFGPGRENAANGDIDAIYAPPRALGKGVGCKLLDAAFGRLGSRYIRVWCAAANERARHRYAHHGLIVDGGAATYDVAGHLVPTVRYTLRR